MNRTETLLEMLTEGGADGGGGGWASAAPCRAFRRPKGPYTHIHDHGKTSATCSLCAQAREICSGCPFVFECLAEVVADEKRLLSSDIRRFVPIRAGLTGREQYRLVNQLKGDGPSQPESTPKKMGGKSSRRRADRHGSDGVSSNGAGVSIRRMILDCLESGPGTLRGLADQLGVPRATVRYHLRRLRRAGIVSADSKPGAASRYELMPAS